MYNYPVLIHYHRKDEAYQSCNFSKWPADSVEFGEAKASSGSTDTGHSASKSTNNVMETPTFEETSSDDTETSAEIDDEFPF